MPEAGRSSGTFAPAATALAALLCAAAPLRAQATGTILGRVIDAQAGDSIPTAEVLVMGTNRRTVTAADGRFVLLAVPVGQRSLRVQALGYQPRLLEGIRVHAGRPTELRVELRRAALEVPGLVVQAERVRLIEPEVNVTHEVVVGRELRELPVDRIQEAIELVPGVSDGHFRGGRIGQEIYVLDGLELKNPLEASTQGGVGLELSPTAIEEVDVLTGGFGAEYGSALSGVVSYVTRRGSNEAWEGSAALLTDHWAPPSLLRGFSSLSASAGGPLPLLGAGTTVFADLLAQGMLDAEPRARGLSCIEPDEAAPDLAAEIGALLADRAAAHLYCPYTTRMLPHQAGDKLIAFLRLDRPLGHGAALTASVLRNRLQRQLYTPEFKYNRDYQLGQRWAGTLLTLALEWTSHRSGQARSFTARLAAMRLDRHLGALDLLELNDRVGLAGFVPSSYHFLGQEFVRRPLGEQLAEGTAVPGYLPPGGTTGSPFGPAAEGIFFTAGTPHLANWSRSGFLGGDVSGQFLSADGSGLRLGSSARFYRVESYERVLSHLHGSRPYYARFYPATIAGFGELRLGMPDEVTFQLGVRLEAFRSGLGFRRERGDFLAPVIATQWKLGVMPRGGEGGISPAWSPDGSAIASATSHHIVWRSPIGL